MGGRPEQIPGRKGKEGGWGGTWGRGQGVRGCENGPQWQLQKARGASECLIPGPHEGEDALEKGSRRRHLLSTGSLVAVVFTLKDVPYMS